MNNTLKIIKKYNNKIPHWISKKILGSIDAFNKGMKIASGEYIGFLNSDDRYTSKAFYYLKDILKKFLTQTLYLDL